MSFQVGEERMPCGECAEYIWVDFFGQGRDSPVFLATQ